MRMFVFILWLLPFTIKSQYILIPDKNFEIVLKDLGYDSRIDGKVKIKKIKDVTSLVLNVAWFEKNSDDISGVEDLT